MIISYEFPGDSREVARAQHDVYYEALEILVKNCNKFASFARRLIKSENYQNWGTVHRFDHRTLQFQHDLLATVWRFESQAAQLRVDCEEDAYSVQQRWLNWLTIEVQSWIERPEWVRLTQIILENQNTPLGQRTEAMLSMEIMNYFPEVPWKDEMKLAIIRDTEQK